MQCVERDLVTLDGDVRSVLHELQDLDIIGSDENGNFVTKGKNTTAITLRQLLTHTSGFAYEFNNPLLQQWRKQQPENEHRSSTTIPSRFITLIKWLMTLTIPLTGTDWSYGPSIDWVGVLIERITQLNLQDYMKQYIWEPLGITDMTFFLSTRLDLRSRLAYMSFRSQDTVDSDITTARINPVKLAESQPALEPDLEDAEGGSSIYTSPVEYFKVVRALLFAISDSASDAISIPPAQLLRRSTANAMFAPQLAPASRSRFQEFSEHPHFNLMMGGLPIGTSVDHGLAGLIIAEDLPGWRHRGTMSWSGTPNLFWWIDRDAGLCGLYASQLLPIGDAKSIEMAQFFEKEIYALHAAASKI
ncbi:hypothetical protein ACHAQJ_007180 [Trichoderma viride]